MGISTEKKRTLQTLASPEKLIGTKLSTTFSLLYCCQWIGCGKPARSNLYWLWALLSPFSVCMKWVRLRPRSPTPKMGPRNLRIYDRSSKKRRCDWRNALLPCIKRLTLTLIVDNLRSWMSESSAFSPNAIGSGSAQDAAERSAPLLR